MPQRRKTRFPRHNQRAPHSHPHVPFRTNKRVIMEPDESRREPEKAEGRPHGPQPKKTATTAISQIGSMITDAGVIAEIQAYPLGGDPRRRHHLCQLFGRRRVSRELDDLLDDDESDGDVYWYDDDMSEVDVDWYHVTGLDLGVAEREQAAGVTR